MVIVLITLNRDRGAELFHHRHIVLLPGNGNYAAIPKTIHADQHTAAVKTLQNLQAWLLTTKDL